MSITDYHGSAPSSVRDRKFRAIEVLNLLAIYQQYSRKENKVVEEVRW